mmetsp:Transcript_8253/g.27151  ORF Transcript_8253/g.27151 Transcript_8253/m.27151 type:complete len:203 (+) Transcript_8253:197-805(+)
MLASSAISAAMSSMEISEITDDVVGFFAWVGFFVAEATLGVVAVGRSGMAIPLANFSACKFFSSSSRPIEASMESNRFSRFFASSLIGVILMLLFDCCCLSCCFGCCCCCFCCCCCCFCCCCLTSFITFVAAFTWSAAILLCTLAFLTSAAFFASCTFFSAAATLVSAAFFASSAFFFSASSCSGVLRSVATKRIMPSGFFS